MTTRSRIHMLTVAAARLEETYSNPQLVADLRKTATALSKEHAAGVRAKDEIAAEEKRIERQRTLFTMLGDTRVIDRLKAAMLQRAYDLMWDGDCTATDALVEFLPRADVERMFDAWMEDQDGKKPKSEFYGAR